LRVLILNSARKWIGEAAHSLALAVELQRAGHRVILGVRRGFELEQRAREAGIEVEALHMGSRFHPLRDLGDCLRIRRLVRENGIDILHANRGKDHWLAAVGRLLMRGAPPLVRTRHVVTPARGHWFNRWLYARGSDALTAVSHAAMDSLGRLGDRIPPERRRVIYSAVDSERFRPERRSESLRRELGAGPDDVLVGLVARFQRVKGQRYFLESAAELTRRGLPCCFCLSGRSDENQRRAMAETAARIGAPVDRLVIQGWTDDLPALVASFDIGVIASVGSEGSSRVGLEYMASGLAIVATRVGGIPEILDDGRTGLLVAPRDPVAMADAIERLVRQVDLRAAMGRAGRAAATTEHTPERWAQEMASLYRDVQPF